MTTRRRRNHARRTRLASDVLKSPSCPARFSVITGNRKEHTGRPAAGIRPVHLAGDFPGDLEGAGEVPAHHPRLPQRPGRLPPPQHRGALVRWSTGDGRADALTIATLNWTRHVGSAGPGESTGSAPAARSPLTRTIIIVWLALRGTSPRDRPAILRADDGRRRRRHRHLRRPR